MVPVNAAELEVLDSQGNSVKGHIPHERTCRAVNIKGWEWKVLEEKGW